MAKLYLKWTALVWVNAIVGLFLGSSMTSVAHNVGMVLGVCLFIPIYVWLDNYAIKTGNCKLQKSLFIGALFRAGTQFVVMVDLIAGMMASMIVEKGFGFEATGIIGYNPMFEGRFWYGFLMTVTTGVILSGVVGVLTMGIMLLVRFLDKGDNRANQPPQN